MMEISHRTGDPKESVEAPCREAEPVDRMPQEALAVRSRQDRPAERGRRQRRIAGRPAQPAGAAHLALPGGCDPGPDGSGGLPGGPDASSKARAGTGT